MQEDLHPVMVIIHLGGFATGSAMLYGDYDDIAANFVSKGIVVVVIQYRLGVHGKRHSGDVNANLFAQKVWAWTCGLGNLSWV